MFTKIYIDLFSGVFSTKMKRTNTLKVEYTIEMKFLSGNWISGRENTSKFTHVHWWTPSPGFSLSRQHVDDEPSMCSSVQLALITSGRSLSSHSSSMLKVPVNPGPRRRSVDFKFWKVWNFHALISTSHSGFTYRLVKSSHPNI